MAPTAPVAETQRWLKPDSCQATASARRGSTPQRGAVARTIAASCGPDGTQPPGDRCGGPADAGEGVTPWTRWGIASRCPMITISERGRWLTRAIVRGLTCWRAAMAYSESPGRTTYVRVTVRQDERGFAAAWAGTFSDWPA